MMSKLKSVLKGERGITGLETAIILVAFVVVAAVFSFAVLSAGTFATQKSEEAVYAGLEQVRATVQLKGTVYGRGSGQGGTYTVTQVIFSLANVSGGEPVDLTNPTSNVLVIDYIDEQQHVTDLPWWKAWMGQNDADDLLEAGEMAEITVPLTGTGLFSPSLGINTDFALHVKPQQGAVLQIERRTPGTIDLYMPLRE